MNVNKLLLKQHLQIIFLPNLNLKSYFKRSKIFQRNKRLEKFVKPEPYLELSRAPTMELFCKTSELISAIFAKSFIIDARLGSKYTSEKSETFKMKLRLTKSSRLLKCAGFLVLPQTIFKLILQR